MTYSILDYVQDTITVLFLDRHYDKPYILVDGFSVEPTDVEYASHTSITEITGTDSSVCNFAEGGVLTKTNVLDVNLITSSNLCYISPTNFLPRITRSVIPPMGNTKPRVVAFKLRRF